MSGEGGVISTISVFLLFFLVGGIAAGVDPALFKSRIRAKRGILIGLFNQFLLLPLLGFFTVRFSKMSDVPGIMLIATTCSPGGAFSNWWCSLFNADVALSVAMTAVSTMISIVAMPVNMYVYVLLAYGKSLSLEWWNLVLSLGVTLAAIVSGLAFGYWMPRWRGKISKFGNVSGVVLIVFGTLTSSRSDPLWDKDATFYLAVACPCVLGLALALLLAWCCSLEGPQRVTVTLEAAYQNTSIAMTLALVSLPEEDQSTAAGVPLYYGVVEIVVLPLFLFTAWRLNMTYAPPSSPISKVLLADFQPRSEMDQAAGKADLQQDLEAARAEPEEKMEGYALQAAEIAEMADPMAEEKRGDAAVEPDVEVECKSTKATSKGLRGMESLANEQSAGGEAADKAEPIEGYALQAVLAFMIEDEIIWI